MVEGLAPLFDLNLELSELVLQVKKLNLNTVFILSVLLAKPLLISESRSLLDLRLPCKLATLPELLKPLMFTLPLLASHVIRSFKPAFLFRL